MGRMFDIQIEGVAEALGDLEAIQGRIKSVVPDLARDTALIVQGEVDEIFNSAPSTTSGGSVYGGKTWSRLTDAYLAQRPDRIDGQIYRDTGALLNSLSLGEEGNIFDSDGSSVTFGTSLPKAGPLNKQREFLFPTDAMVESIAALWKHYIVTGEKP